MSTSLCGDSLVSLSTLLLWFSKTVFNVYCLLPPSGLFPCFAFKSVFQHGIRWPLHVLCAYIRGFSSRSRYVTWFNREFSRGEFTLPFFNSSSITVWGEPCFRLTVFYSIIHFCFYICSISVLHLCLRHVLCLYLHLFIGHIRSALSVKTVILTLLSDRMYLKTAIILFALVERLWYISFYP